MTLSLGLGNQQPELFVRGGHKGLNQSLGLSQPMVSVVSTGAWRCFTFIHWGAYSPDPLAPSGASRQSDRWFRQARGPQEARGGFDRRLALLHFYSLGSVLPRPLGAIRSFETVRPVVSTGSGAAGGARWFRQARGPQEAQGGSDRLGARRKHRVVSTNSGAAGSTRWLRQARGPQEATGGSDNLVDRRQRPVVPTISWPAGNARWFRQSRGPQEAQGGSDNLNHRRKPKVVSTISTTASHPSKERNKNYK
jgi:hypothetical protein